MFSKALVGVRDASCRTSDLYTDLMEEGGDSAVTEAQTVEKKPSCVPRPRLKTRPGCCYLSRHCLLKCWHFSLNDGFQFSQNIPKAQCGKHPLFPALIWRRSICFLILLRSWVQISWLQHNHNLRTDGGSYSSIKEMGFAHPKKYNYEVLGRENHSNCWEQRSYKQLFFQSWKSWKAPSFPLSLQPLCNKWQWWDGFDVWHLR